MADSESSDVLANLPAGRPTRRSSRRAPATTQDASSGVDAAAETNAAPAKPTAKKAAAKKRGAKKAAAKRAPAKHAPAKKPAAAKAKTAAAKKASAKRAPKPVPVAATTAGEIAARSTTQRRPRIATPPEGRRADYTGGATHRARKVTTNRPWLPSSGFVLPEEKIPNQVTTALGGLGSALADVARIGLGVASSLAVRRREIEAPEPELTEQD